MSHIKVALIWLAVILVLGALGPGARRVVAAPLVSEPPVQPVAPGIPKFCVAIDVVRMEGVSTWPAVCRVS